ncbi:winged helix-turn-helix transcriptional regulator [Sphingobacterium rhinopitheci]|uniref:winged helix-turn-helix transcriptional regulator n=1 Tax=Sphingobacterium rhinopitheci TaxID=2781960 RepID=UPI001F518608|nr:helix-turn-helix domain-containing protein [Sphingobacterium rhinopitheci]MCI0922676.1 helix-turn-helix transcriptional regulator [Sphingobacterium rhinopitheci]
MEKQYSLNEIKSCPVEYILNINDTLNVLSGKWRLPIIGSVLYGKKRFTDIQRNIPKISPRMLSKELKELELNGVLVRKIHHTIPVLVEYELSESGKLITEVLDKMIEWGIQHRKAVLQKS